MTPMVEVLATIDAPHFNAGIVLQNDRVVEAAPILRYILFHQGLDRDRGLADGASAMTYDFNFYAEDQVETINALPRIVIDCDLTGWTFEDLIRAAYEAELMLWTALYDLSEDGELIPRWKGRHK